MPARREISHAEARGLVAMIGDRLEASGKGAAVAVVDRHGELVAFLRTDGCRLASTAIRFLIRDRDTTFVGPFDEVFRSEGARVIPPGDHRAPSLGSSPAG